MSGTPTESPENEIWKAIPDAMGYMASSLGRIRMTKKMLCLKPVVINGYLKVSIVHKGKRRSMKVARLIASTFHENPENKPEVDHIDGNGQNNRADNLRWVTKSENMKAYVNSERFKDKRMRTCLKLENDTEVCFFASISEACRHFGKAIGTIWGAVKDAELNPQHKWRGYSIKVLSESEYEAATVDDTQASD